MPRLPPPVFITYRVSRVPAIISQTLLEPLRLIFAEKSKISGNHFY